MFAVMSSLAGIGLAVVSLLVNMLCCALPMMLFDMGTMGFGAIITLPLQLCCVTPGFCLLHIFSCIILPVSNICLDIFTVAGCCLSPTFVCCPPVWCCVGLPICGMDLIALGGCGLVGFLGCLSTPIWGIPCCLSSPCWIGGTGGSILVGLCGLSLPCIAGIGLITNPEYCQICQFAGTSTMGNAGATASGCMAGSGALSQQCLAIPMSLLNLGIGGANSLISSCYNPCASMLNTGLAGSSQLIGMLNAITQLFNIQFHCI